ncbi:hypothetical protein WMY93_021017 [Mugilogobius chulae]|uniref:Kisspeptin n=1 Tax=Mugilogobius chulae TaxID=88201 RepID=A0AAW0NEE2_9GOBI
MVLSGDVWLLTVLALGGLMLGQDGGMGVPLRGALVHGGMHTADGHTLQLLPPPLQALSSLQALPPLQALSSLQALPPLRSLRDVLPDDSSVCVSETEERLLCTEHSRYNLNTFGLRFGKRHTGSRHLRRTSSAHLPVPAYGPKLLPT